MKKFRDGLTEAKDRGFELTVSRLGRRVWNEMKENGHLASTLEKGGMKIAAGACQDSRRRKKQQSRVSYRLLRIDSTAPA
jgi:hypothetical protein